MLSPTWAVQELGEDGQRWQLLVRLEPPGVDPDARGSAEGWEATPHQRFERLLRETGVFAGLLISEKKETKDGEDRHQPELRLVYAPRGETSGYLNFPLRDHFEQNRHVRHRLERYGAGRCMDYATSTPEVVAEAIAAEIDRPIDYRPVETDGAARAAALIAPLI